MWKEVVVEPLSVFKSKMDKVHETLALNSGVALENIKLHKGCENRINDNQRKIDDIKRHVETQEASSRTCMQAVEQFRSRFSKLFSGSKLNPQFVQFVSDLNDLFNAQKQYSLPGLLNIYAFKTDKFVL